MLTRLWADAAPLTSGSEFGSEVGSDAGHDQGGGRGLALAAVGSLALGELGPKSDLDLVLLHDGRRPAREIAALADRLWYPLWDAGWALDHSVRTPAQCRAVAGADLPATIGLLDLDCVAGDADLVVSTQQAIGADWRSLARKRLPELVEAVQARHARAGELAHLLEPDLKEARGGLRDMTVLRALTRAWLADRPHGEVDEAYQRLLDVRDAVHLVTGRSRSRLHRQDLPEVARCVDPRSDGAAAVTAFTRDLSEQGRAVALALDSTMRRAGQSQRARRLRVGPRRAQLRPLGDGVYVADGEAVAGRGFDADDPAAALVVAVAAVRAGVPLAPVTVANLAAGLLFRSAPCSAFGSPPGSPPESVARTRQLFVQLLSVGEPLTPVWEALTLSGIVEVWMPQWSAVRSLAQVSPVHRHTVDRHQVQTVIECAPLLTSVTRPDLLLMAALTHDLGKGVEGADHAAAGVEPAGAVCRRWGFCEQDTAVVQRLVAEHLTLVSLATTRDPEDPRTVHELLSAVAGDRDNLALLHALTIADARAAGPRAWTEQRAGLVDALAARARALGT